MRIIVTGSAGFIGHNLSLQLLAQNHEVIGIDNLNDYYDVNLKKARLAQLEAKPGFTFYLEDIANREAIDAIFQKHPSDVLVNLAAQAGVRYSIENPHSYVQSNMVGFINVLDAAQKTGVKNVVYASSSSVYGANKTMPFSETHNIDHPLSLYAASKKANELMAHTYSHLHNLPTTGLRFFTVYGPWSRPDMAMFKFTDAILNDRPIDVYNYGKHRRDFTYIDDIVAGIILCIETPAKPDDTWQGETPNPATSAAPYRVYNIGCNQPVELMDYIEALEDALGKKAEKNLLPMQAGDMPDTYADVGALKELGYKPTTQVKDGVKAFVKWYRDFYRV